MKGEKMELEVTALKGEMNLFVQTSPEGHCDDPCFHDCSVGHDTYDSHYTTLW